MLVTIWTLQVRMMPRIRCRKVDVRILLVDLIKLLTIVSFELPSITIVGFTSLYLIEFIPNANARSFHFGFLPSLLCCHGPFLVSFSNKPDLQMSLIITDLVSFGPYSWTLLGLELKLNFIVHLTKILNS